MKRGLVLGKFMPLHNGHVALIEYAAARCDELIVLICATKDEPIDGELRSHWVKDIFKGDARIKPRSMMYDDQLLPNTSVSSDGVSALWAKYLLEHLPKIDTVFASEIYGEYLAAYMDCDHRSFDVDRLAVPISATQIREKPFGHWEHIPVAVRPYFVKKICLYGTESTGKSTLTVRLAEHFCTSYVPEMAREIIEKTGEVQPHHLTAIAKLHAETINTKITGANKLLFIDTDLNITRSYNKFLFGTALTVPEWVEEANRVDIYLYLSNDAPYIQDGTRLDKSDRDRLDLYHQRELLEQGISYHLLSGSWDDRFNQAVALVDALLAG